MEATNQLQHQRKYVADVDIDVRALGVPSQSDLIRVALPVENLVLVLRLQVF